MTVANPGRWTVFATAAAVLIGFCSLSRAQDAAAQGDPSPAAPPSLPIAAPVPLPVMPPLPANSLENPRVITGSSTAPRRVDTRLLPPPPRPFPGPKISIKHILEGEAEKIEKVKEGRRMGREKVAVPRGPQNGPRGTPGAMFPGSDTGSSPFQPPDLTVAVGPSNVIMTANSLLSIYDKDGTPVQEIMLFGSSGLFGDQGAGGFVFDPKCLYDALEDRFVIVALEYYQSPRLSSILIAVSDPGDAQNYTTFRTDSKQPITGVGDTWFDYPGFGYDANCYYVTGNLFTFGDFAAFRGVKFRCFNKAKLFNGQAIENFKDVDDYTRSFASVQASQHMSQTATPYFVSVAAINENTLLQVHSIKDPIANPTRFIKVAQVPYGYDGPDYILACCEDATDPGCGAGFINTVDDRVFNAVWRDGNLYTAHHFTDLNGIVTARWYQVATNNWPLDTSQSPLFVQGGDIPGGSAPDGRPIHTFFPAIHVAGSGNVGVVLGMAVDGECAQVAYAGRLVADPAGAMSAPVAVKASDGQDQDEFRWGDYYGIAVDPIDDETFWGIGQWNKQFLDLPGENDGWSSWIFSFDVESVPSLFAVDDGVDVAIEVPQDTAIEIDVLANDYDSQGLNFDIDGFDGISANGGFIELSVGTGPGGRNEVRYTSPGTYQGEDTFTYTIRNTADTTDTATVRVMVTSSDFREPDVIGGLTENGIDVTYYEGSTAAEDFPTTLPAPYLTTTVPNFIFPESEGVPFANSGRSEGTVAVFTGYMDIPQTAVYEFCFRRGSGASLLFGEDVLIQDTGVHTPSEGTICGTIGLKKGTHMFTVNFFHASGPHGLMLRATGGPLSDEFLPDTWYLRPADCVADFDGSGFPDTDDFTAFVLAFELGDEAADVDQSGFVDTDDFDYFVCAFENGCQCP
ncbi:MAG: hypothetical protein AMXMBFR58_20480 [Phycisphaerae bacterium]